MFKYEPCLILFEFKVQSIPAELATAQAVAGDGFDPFASFTSKAPTSADVLRHLNASRNWRPSFSVST